MSFIVQPQTFFAIGPSRSFAGVSGYITLSESASDVLEITQQPVQQGASISDHAFKKPVSFSIQILFEDNLTQSLADIYQKLRSLQEPSLPVTAPTDFNGAQPTPVPQLTPFTVVTPKRTYYNMLLSSLGQTTDKKTENCLSISASFQEVIIVPVATANVPRSQLRNPGSNGGTQNVGQKQSSLYTGAQAIGAKP